MAISEVDQLALRSQHTAFDQSLTCLSAVVKGGVLGETFGPYVESDECGGG